jgi:hypothetical protein
MNFTVKEKKLLRLSLDPGASSEEAANAWARLLPLLRKRGLTGYDLEGMTAAITENISDYFSAIGRKGGRASKGTFEAGERAQKAAQARWRKSKK